MVLTSEPDQSSGIAHPKEGFQKTSWLDQTIPVLEKLQPEQTVELVIPQGMDYRFFIAELGRSARPYEFGGVCNPNTGSTIVIKGYAVGEKAAFSNATTSFVKSRSNPDGSTDDIFFHTHPWSEDEPLRELRQPDSSCRPSDSDINNTMALRTIEEEAGFERTVVLIIGSRGFISVTEASGVKFNESSLTQAGLTDSQILEIKRYLALSPPVWLKNYAKDPASEADLIRIVNEYYLRRTTDKSASFSTKKQELQEQIRPYVKNDSYRRDDLQRLVDSLTSHFPKYPGGGFLTNIGLSPEQSAMVKHMTGVTITVFKVDGGIPPSQIYE